MTLFSRSLRVALASGLTVALAGLALTVGGASASAATDKNGNQVLTPIADHADMTGVVRIDFGPSLAGYTVDVTAEDPADIEVASLQSADIGSDGFAEITNFAGPAYVQIESFSAPSSNLGDSSVWPPAPVPLVNHTVNIYRAQTVTYVYDPQTTGYTLQGVAPAPVIPQTETEAAHLLAVTNSTVTPATWVSGQDLTLSFTRVTPNGVGDYTEFTEPVWNFVYSSPTPLGATTIVASAYSFVVPGAYTAGGHTAATFDEFGRLVSLVPLNAATTATAAASSGGSAATASLANTGQNDVLPIGVSVLVLFALGGTAIFISRKAARA